MMFLVWRQGTAVPSILKGHGKVREIRTRKLS